MTVHCLKGMALSIASLLVLLVALPGIAVAQVEASTATPEPPHIRAPWWDRQ